MEWRQTGSSVGLQPGTLTLPSTSPHPKLNPNPSHGHKPSPYPNPYHSPKPTPPLNPNQVGLLPGDPWLAVAALPPADRWPDDVPLWARTARYGDRRQVGG